jgi:hypothetical protein
MTPPGPNRFVRFSIPLLLAGTAAVLALFAAPGALTAFAQQPTGSIPTVTGTAVGATVKVYADRDIIEVYAGPDSYLYPPVGILVAGEEAPALGYSLDGDWIQIVYLGTPAGVGWIYAPYVSITPGFTLPVIAAPPTATPRVTPTINPTTAAAYGLQLTPERLPTFTQAAPVEVPEFGAESDGRARVPVGFLILVLALLGILGAIISFVRGGR